MIRRPLVRLTPSLLVLVACASAPPRVQLVESVPAGTTLDHADIANAADVWVAMIDHARTSIDLAEFYASNAPASRLEPVVRALEAAIRRGVRVRFLAEASFEGVYPDTLARLQHAGAAVRSIILSTGGALHAKYFVVDGTEAFLGSQNFDWRALEHNYELGLRVRDAAVAGDLEAIFALDWAHAGNEPAPQGTAPASALVASPWSLLPAGIAWEVPALVRLLDGARRTIHVQLLTYRPDFRELDAALVRAAARGVAVDLAVSDWAKDPALVPGLRALATTHGITVHYIVIPQWSGTFIPYARVAHAKLLVVDGARAWIGTGNWEREYFYDSRNVGLLVDDRDVVRQIEEFFADALHYSVRFDPDEQYTPPRIH
jgi:phosphatidylserine/phosphatidylglycerophosphate/cardiolipin synthase-like enzyme